LSVSLHFIEWSLRVAYLSARFYVVYPALRRKTSSGKKAVFIQLMIVKLKLEPSHGADRNIK
jgi:hypothetical protein